MTQGEVIILRLLHRRDQYGYELDKIIEENQMRQWADIGFSSIYHLLNKLEKKGLVDSYAKKEPGSPKRKVYCISPDGRAALREEVIRMLETPAESHSDFVVGLVTSDILDEDEFRRSLKAYRTHLQKRRELYMRAIPEETRRKERVVLALNRIVRLIDAEIDWLKEL